MAFNKQTLQNTMKKIIASDISELNNEIFEFANITEVEVTGDLKDATIYYTLIEDGTNEEHINKIQDLQKALDSAKGRLRSSLSRQIRIRLIPSLTFKYDDLETNYATLEDKIAEALAADKVKSNEAKRNLGISNEDYLKNNTNYKN
ncbi:MAG: 30S ribosome-binding factor RbfA [Bifidobacteriaceae bacterium]|jgi:ribosome-binding factor A|nr:30S ribosome-binding factor RbfA [Bifidobacteriaceae bacterium]